MRVPVGIICSVLGASVLSFLAIVTLIAIPWEGPPRWFAVGGIAGADRPVTRGNTPRPAGHRPDTAANSKGFPLPGRSARNCLLSSGAFRSQ